MPLFKILCLACLLLAGCAATKMTVTVTDPALVRALTPPVKIFGIGYWGKDYMVLTLLDAHHQYLTVITRRDELLKEGQVYKP